MFNNDFYLLLFVEKKDIKDEYHFVLICPANANIRTNYLNANYTTKPCVYKSVELLKRE